MIFVTLKKCVDGVLSSRLINCKNIGCKSFKTKPLKPNEKTRKYYEKKWNDYFQNKRTLGCEFVLDKGDWISNSSGVFGFGKGFTSKGSIKCSGGNKKFIINLKKNTIGNSRSDILYSSQIISVLSGAICEIKNGVLKAKNVYDKGSVLYVGMYGVLDCKSCYFEGSHTNRSGGVIYGCEHSDIKLTNCKFNNNSANGFGGAVFVESNSNFQCVNCEFINNSSKFARGGAIYFKDSSKNLCLQSCTFKNNKSRYCNETVFVGDNNNLLCSNCNFKHGDYYDLVYAHKYANVELVDCDNNILLKEHMYGYLKS